MATALLFSACARGDTAGVTAALRAGGRASASDAQRKTPAMYAAAGSHAEALSVLLAHAEALPGGASPLALARRANETGTDLADLGVSPAQVAAVQALVDAKTINDKLARQVFDGLVAGEGTPEEIVAARGLAVVSDDGALIIISGVDTADDGGDNADDDDADGRSASVAVVISITGDADDEAADANNNNDGRTKLSVRHGLYGSMK